MLKLLLILLIGLMFEAAGVVFLKKGMVQIGEMKSINVAEVIRVIKAGASNPQIWLGVFFEALFFGCLVVLLSKADISFLWPLTGLSFVFSTFAAILFFREHVSPVRWLGVALVVLGAALISYSEHVKPKKQEPVAASSENPSK